MKEMETSGFGKLSSDLNCETRRLLHKLAECYYFSSGSHPWSSDFCLQHLKDAILESPVLRIDDLDDMELEQLGFGKWDESGLRLIPVWISMFLDPSMEVYCIDGSVARLGEADKDHRFGCLAYGIFPKES